MTRMEAANAAYRAARDDTALMDATRQRIRDAEIIAVSQDTITKRWTAMVAGINGWNHFHGGSRDAAVGAAVEHLVAFDTRYSPPIWAKRQALGLEAGWGIQA